jgi:tRNA(Ile)-lysidine synthase
MARLGPFERGPRIAVGVSGGPDSMALTLRLAEWAQARGGLVEALTVDHGLRAESAEEATQVGRWLARLPGVTHHTLHWTGAKPETGIQAAARDARYRLLAGYCRDHAILHLCTAHHRDDQQETHRLRAGHGSGTMGLAGMSAIRALNGVRLLRPLLGVPKAELLELLSARAQPWLSDPSNDNPVFERARLRAEGPAIAEHDAATLHRLGLQRRHLEAAAADLLATTLVLHDSGWAELEAVILAEPVAPNALLFGWLLQSLGGSDYPVGEGRRLEALARIRSDPAADFTLGGCHVRRLGAKLEIYRDWGAIRHRLVLQAGMAASNGRPGPEQLRWDDRFAVTLAPHLSARLAPTNPDLTIARLGEVGLRQLGQMGHSQAERGIPEPARKALPALWQGDRLVAVPHLGFGPGLDDGGLEARFRPGRPAASGGFTVA